MLKTKWLQVLTLAVAGVGFGFAPAADASAGTCSNNGRSYDRGHERSHDRDWSHRERRHTYHNQSHSRSRVVYRNDNVRFSVTLGSDRSYDRREHHRPRYERRSSCDQPVVYHAPQPSGYWKRVYRPPVYETRYSRCGRAYRVCVRAGYYERVWVETSRSRRY